MQEDRADLDPALARSLLSGLGRTDPNSRFDARPLGGGVSSTVLLVENGPWRHVLKQPLGRFRVRDEWTVDTSRTKVEFEVARFLERHLGPERIAQAIAYDAASEVLVLEAIAAPWTTWKSRLLGGEVRPELAAEAGTFLARLHALVDFLPQSAFRQDELFRQQRIAPYFEASALRRPELAEDLGRMGRAFLERNDFVHGDFSPKNLMTNGFEVRLVDHEVTTRGDAAFDVAFLLNHLLLKRVHLPKWSEELGECLLRAWRSYVSARAEASQDFEVRVVGYLGALHLARAIGKSRAEYLTEGGREVVEEIGSRILATKVQTVAGALTVASEIAPSA